MFELTGLLLQQFRTELEDIVGVEHVLDEMAARREASGDQYWVDQMWHATEQERTLPHFVVRPISTEEVSRVVRLCNTYKVPVVTRGLGSGTQGGATTLYGGIVLSLDRMDRIIEIDKTSLVLDAQPGINGKVLEDALNAEGLMLAHYPSSAALASLGGYLAARGSGVMSTKYGKAEDMVLSLEVVLPDGTIVNTLPVPNHANGPGLLQMFVGSEGTLGVITRVRMRLDPLPEARLFRVFEFPSVAAGLEAGRQIMTQRLDPATIRLYDEGATQKSLRDTGHDLDGVNAVIMVDGFEDVASAQMARIMRICESVGGIDKGSEEGQHWWDHRYDFYQPPLQPGYPLLYGTVETLTTFANIERLYDAKRELVLSKFAEWDVKYTAHFSHWYPWGAMIYDRFYIQSPPADPIDALRLHNEIWTACSRVNLEITGMLNEHHGVGFKLGRLMREQAPEHFDLLLKIKQLMDPKSIMNPGKLGFGIW